MSKENYANLIKVYNTLQLIETKGENTNNSITLNGTIANNNYKYYNIDIQLYYHQL